MFTREFCFRSSQSGPALWTESFPLPFRGFPARGLLAAACLLALQVLTIPHANASQRVSIAIVPLTNASGATNLDHWVWTMNGLLEGEFHDMKSVQITPLGSINYALKELGLKQGQMMDAKQAMKLAAICDADRVIWGTYEQRGGAGSWRLKLKMLDAAKGHTTALTSISTAHLADALDRQAAAILSRLKLPDARPQLWRIQTTSTNSDKALTLVSQAYADIQNGGTVETALRKFQSAVELEPKFADAQYGLSRCLESLGRCEEAITAAKALAADHPGEAFSHSNLGMIYSDGGFTDLAKEELQRTRELEPKETEAAFQLAYLSVEKSDWTNAAAILEEAKTNSPFNATIRALLGFCLASLRQTNEAYAELALAEKYVADRDDRSEQWLGWGYNALYELKEAVDHFSKYLRMADAAGLTNDAVQQIRAYMPELEARLTPHPVRAVMPRSYTPAELASELQARVGPEAAATIDNPLTATPEMDQWARQLVGDAQDDSEKARRLFDGLSRRAKTGGEHAPRTAIEVFKAWQDPREVFICQDYTDLYVALARSAGLKAYFVSVSRDYAGRWIDHACAGVFVNNLVYLVDPTWAYFGAPHKEYEIEDDIDMIALHLSESDDTNKLSMALKIAPDLPQVHYFASGHFDQAGDHKRAEEEIDAFIKLAPHEWDALFMKARRELVAQQLAEAETDIRQCLGLNPDAPGVKVALAEVVATRGGYEEAREVLNSLLDGAHKDEEAEVHQLLDWINTKSTNVVRQTPPAK